MFEDYFLKVRKEIKFCVIYLKLFFLFKFLFINQTESANECRVGLSRL